MKILHIAGTSGLYGTSHVILTLLPHLNNLGIDVSLATFGSEQLANIAKNMGGINVYYGNEDKILNADFINDLGCDIIHLHDYKSSILIATKKLCKLIRTPTLRTLHGYTGASKPWYDKIHLYQGIDKLSVRLHDCRVGVSEDMRYKFGFNIDYIVQNGIDSFIPDNSIDYAFSEKSKERYVIGCIARLSKEKNLDNLIKGISELSKNRDILPQINEAGKSGIALVIFGDGGEREYLKGLIRDLGLEPGENNYSEVHLMGFNKNAKEYFDYFDLYIQPSYTEGTPISVLEALSTKTPMILTAVGGMKHIIDQGAADVCGTSSFDIADAVIKHIKSKNVLQREKVGYNLFLSDYTSSAMTKKYVNIYEKLLGV